MYIGLKVLGVVGLLLLPIVTIIIKKLNDDGKLHIFKKPPDKS